MEPYLFSEGFENNRIGAIFTQGLVGLGNRGGVQGHLHLRAPFKRQPLA